MRRRRNEYTYHQSSYYRKRAFLRIGILVIIFLLALIGFFSYFSQYSGTFVISLDKYSQSGLSLSETSDFIAPTSVLHVSSRKRILPIEYKTVPIDNILNTDGNSTEPNCFGYTYYLKNVGETVVDVGVNIIQEAATLGLDRCARVMLLQDDIPIGVFKVADNYIDPEDQTPKELYKQYFGSGVYTYRIDKLYPGDVVKFSVLIWVEGWDIDCTDEKQGGAVQYNMTIGILDEYNIEDLERN